jgi:hypothetical protein
MDGRNEASDEVRRGTGEESREWAVRELVGDFPNRKGVPDRSRADAELIVDALLGAPEPWLEGWQRQPGCVLAAHRVVDYARENGFLHRKGTTGWLDRDGRLLACAYSAHERLIHGVLQRTVADVEADGWARVNRSAWQCGFRLSEAQRRALANLGLGVDRAEERLKPDWEPPPAAAPTPGRR